MSRSKPSKHWTVMAGLIFAWNVSCGRRGAPPFTEVARKHPVATLVWWTALGYHLAPWRDSPHAAALPGEAGAPRVER